MIRNLVMGVGAFALIAYVGTASTQQVNYGTAADARAMLQKTIAALKSDKAKALAMIEKGTGGFLQGEIYPFCFNISDGKVYPFPNPNAKALFWTDQRTLKDAAGKQYGKEVFDAAQKPEGQITEVHYVFSRPGDAKPSQKISFVTRIGDLGCGVGYYK